MYEILITQISIYLCEMVGKKGRKADSRESLAAQFSDNVFNLCHSQADSNSDSRNSHCYSL